MSSQAFPAHRRGRPPVFDRDACLGALMGLFWSVGYEAATQEEMLRVTGLASSSLYRSFGTKPEIFAAALRRYLDLADDILGPLESGSLGGADLHVFLDRVAGQIRGASGARGCLVVTTLAEPIHGDPRIAELTDRHIRRMAAAVAAGVDRCEARGESLCLPAADLAAAVLAGVLGTLARAVADPTHALRLLDAVRALVPRG